jgi:hypothetical protein
MHASWSRSKQIISAAVVGFVSGGAVAAALLDPSSLVTVSSYSGYANAIGVARNDAPGLSLAGHVSQLAGARVNSGIKARSTTPVAEASVSTSNSAPSIIVEDRSRAIAPWALRNALRDDRKIK